MLIPYSYGHIIKENKFVGIQPCPSCGKFAEYYLARKHFRTAICWIPVFDIPQQRYLRCSACGASAELTKEKYAELKKQYEDMPKAPYMRRAFNEIKTIAGEMTPEERSVDAIYAGLAKKMRIENGGERYRELIAQYLELSTAMNPSEAEEAAAAQTASEEAVPAESGTEPAAAAVETEPAAEPAAEPASESPAAIMNRSIEEKLAAEADAPAGNATGFKKQRLWLFAAIPTLLVALFMLAVCVSLFAETYSVGDLVANIVITLLLVGIPAGLTALFIRLAFRKKKLKK